MPPELEGILGELEKVGDMRSQIASHAKSLAALFLEKAAADETAQNKSEISKVDAKLHEEIERRTAALQQALDQGKADWASAQKGMAEQLSAKPDATWMAEFEAQLRTEMDKLRETGSSSVSKHDLERQLRQLRDRLAALSPTTDGGN